ncbi:hypothetical protein HF295_07050 [Hujiaoplasma nucleasis]|uniref:DUF2268 domain-containing protein n=1 Tax=Hujiaoplasma nucleasis TaxID=2725268 RepID=A0A7L6N361_9MOLU|nr:hypothetical protein [Hujiaoplasma nucleasis]QLY40613.1 hypothetical protein HF295_07050 [Hujiaoplasma nucleasis]
MKITNAIKNIKQLYVNNEFVYERWLSYIKDIFPEDYSIFIDDIKDYDFDNDCLPILNEVIVSDERIINLEFLFDQLTRNLESLVLQHFHKSLDVEIILYLGLCNGAGWVRTIQGQCKVLLGIEKIFELNWDDEKHMIGLIYHELGHVYQNQYGVLERYFNNSKDQYLWQLFTEGVAMVFEQILMNNHNYYHQDDGQWLLYFDKHLPNLANDFYHDLTVMNSQNQRYFGDWVYYNKHNDAGYYLGAKFVQFILLYETFDHIILFNIEKVKTYFSMFLKGVRK